MSQISRLSVRGLNPALPQPYMYVSSLSLSLRLPLTCSLVFLHVHIFSHFHKDLQTYKICLFVCFNVCRVVAFVLRGMDCRIFPVHTNSRNISSSKAILPHHLVPVYSPSLSLPTSLSPPSLSPVHQKWRYGGAGGDGGSRGQTAHHQCLCQRGRHTRDIQICQLVSCVSMSTWIMHLFKLSLYMLLR